ncbi:MAG: GIY-YIG nuclease family protein [Desulfovibrio sp.]|nr:GIY-YIG nuclease family protein [Desulfovibrio sp.]
MAATLDDFITAYKCCHNVTKAEFESGYTLLKNYPSAGFYVYCLIDPRNEEIFYIGKGIGGRVLKHEERTRRGVLQNKAKVKRIQEIFSIGKEVTRRVLFCSESEEVVLAVEDDTIHELAPLGLTNILGGNVVLTPGVLSMAETFRAKVESFRQTFVRA